MRLAHYLGTIARGGGHFTPFRRTVNWVWLGAVAKHRLRDSHLLALPSSQSQIAQSFADNSPQKASKEDLEEDLDAHPFLGSPGTGAEVPTTQCGTTSLSLPYNGVSALGSHP